MWDLPIKRGRLVGRIPHLGSSVAPGFWVAGSGSRARLLDMTFNPALDLRFERKVNCSAAHLWKGGTDPEMLKHWFCPRPWRVTDCSIELKPGGKFWSVMQGLEGERQENTGCYLEVVPERRLVWTPALMRGLQARSRVRAWVLKKPMARFTQLLRTGISLDARTFKKNRPGCAPRPPDIKGQVIHLHSGNRT